MFRYKTLLIAAILAVFVLFCFIHNSEAASITSFSVYAGDDWGSGTTAYASLTADEEISFIDWHIDGKYKFSSEHGNGTNSVYVYLGTFTGHIKGEKYSVRAVVSFVESSDEEASDTFRVYKYIPSPSNGIGSKTGANGYADVSRFYYDGSSVVMSASAYASNNTDKDLKVAVWFRTKEYTGLDGNEIFGREKRDTKPTEDVDKGESSKSYSPDGFVNRAIGDIGDDEYYFDAHTHLHVYTAKGPHKEDHWEADTGVLKFTKADR